MTALHTIDEETSRIEDADSTISPTFVPVAESVVTEAAVPTKPHSRRTWLYDRTLGTSRYDAALGRPPLFLCWAPAVIRACPRILEMNAVMEWVGKIGCFDPESVGIRRFVFGNALVSNLFGFILTFYACFAISNDYSVLKAASFTMGRIDFTKNTHEPIEVYIGLRSIAISNPMQGNSSLVDGITVPFSDLCEYMETNQFLRHSGSCMQCASVSDSIVSSCIMSLLSYIPAVSANVSRMWPNYDVNCQKFFGLVVGLLSMLMSLYTWKVYSYRCFQGFPEGRMPVTKTLGWSMSDDAAYYILNFYWRAGNGMFCIVTATILRMMDCVCHLIIPTPSITRNHEEQEEYGRLATLPMGDDSESPNYFNALQARYATAEAKKAHGMYLKPTCVEYRERR
jgi:hypothetical protein